MRLLIQAKDLKVNDQVFMGNDLLLVTHIVDEGDQLSIAVKKADGEPVQAEIKHDSLLEVKA